MGSGEDSPQHYASAGGNGPTGTQSDSTSSEEPASTQAVQEHVVLLGETLSTIAEQYGTDTAALISLNKIEDANLLLPGRVLLIPGTRSQGGTAPPEAVQSADYEIIADYELVYGPGAKDFALDRFLRDYDGYLLGYEEEVEGRQMDGAAIVQLVAERHSVSPKLLLAVLEYNAGWLTQRQPDKVDYMLGNEQESAEGLYRQLSWAANMLNWGFYGRAEGGLSTFAAGNLELVFAPAISDGTAGAQFYLGARDNVSYEDWLFDAGPEGLAATYRELFGKPFSPAEETTLLPDNLEQPPLLLPWESGETWHFSGGPHGGWNSGSAWAALDFVPPDVEYGCASSESWVTAVAGGVVARSGSGAVVLDLDGDGYAGSGWAISYMHLDDRQRIAEGARVTAGERLGHPGCEGGITNGTHLHLARTYNGRWISADGAVPFNLDGWISGGSGYEYNGWLARDGETKTADVYRTEANAITAD
jgi:murein DD-endopeptidase MepM/ murein hydrolase activator NlpD